MFYVAVPDQVAWTAVVNLVGPYVDSKMPPWSYGHRLYRSIWVEEDRDGIKRRKIGRYRHSSGRLYLPFSQSWPIFRRHVYLTTRAMTLGGRTPDKDLDEKTRDELTIQEGLQSEYRCPFVLKGYWENRRPAGEQRRIYWCGIDLEKFYPTLNVALVRQNIVNQLPPEWRDDADQLLGSMLDFHIDPSPWGARNLGKMGLQPSPRAFPHIPTGLYVAGFLANAGLLSVDLEVARRIDERAIAHFRFVDDHIVLAYSLGDLTDWVREYNELLRTLGTGARVNREKIEPECLVRLVSRDERERVVKGLRALQKRADAACCLDPQFPSPLMTKTLALVSAIARTDFNLLEMTELAALTNQLEHLILVDIPEEEIPQKTRLSFAATRLTRLVECRLATSTPPAELRFHRGGLQAELPLEGPRGEEHEGVDEDVAGLIEREVERVFQLFRRVLRERFDSVRLWTRAFQMCRCTGVDGALDLAADIDSLRQGDRAKKGNPMAAEYLCANALTLSGAEALTAARILRDEEAAHWRKRAARDYLGHLEGLGSKLRPGRKDPWFVQSSWLQYCSALYCADLLLKDKTIPGPALPSVPFRKDELAVGRGCIGDGGGGHPPAHWAWWAVRADVVRHPLPRQEGLAKPLGERLAPSKEAAAFWTFFPRDVPVPILRSMLRGRDELSAVTNDAGWWFDALRERPEIVSSLTPEDVAVLPSAVRHQLESKETARVSLYDWCAYLRKTCKHRGTDPRCGEWTALEIVRQITSLVAERGVFGAEYAEADRNGRTSPPNVHPGNFRVPSEWLQIDEPPWGKWKEMVRAKTVDAVKEDTIRDRRYTPIRREGLFSELNVARGLGLVLYGLLRKTFDLPAIWNGPGHPDVLNKMPRLLLAEMTCSTWTLGILGSCLWPRVAENLFQMRYPVKDYNPDEDTLRDPLCFLSAEGVGSAIKIAQQNLERYQLSTMGERARQLTPVSIRQLTEPDWRRVFEAPGEDGEMLHE
jgi:hypothetical protein